jgi:hypothetical protein
MAKVNYNNQLPPGMAYRGIGATPQGTLPEAPQMTPAQPQVVPYSPMANLPAYSPPPNRIPAPMPAGATIGGVPPPPVKPELIPTEEIVEVQQSPIPKKEGKRLLAETAGAIQGQAQAEAKSLDLDSRVIQEAEANPMFKQALEALQPTMKSVIDAGADREKMLEEVYNTNTKLREKLLAAQKPINPDRWWNSRTNLQKVMSFIGVAFSGLGRQQTGGRNIAAEGIDRAIAEDINLQKYEREQAITDARAIGDTFNTDLAVREQILKHRNEMLAQYYSFMAETVKRIKLSKTTEYNQVAKEQLIEEFKQKSAEAQLNVLKITGDQIARREKKSILEKTSALANPENWTPWGFTTTRASAEDVKKQGTDVMTAEQRLNEMQEFIRNAGKFGVLDPAANSRYEALFRQNLNLMMNLSNSGVLNPGEYEAYKNEIPNLLSNINPRQSPDAWFNQMRKGLKLGWEKYKYGRIPGYQMMDATVQGERPVNLGGK